MCGRVNIVPKEARCLSSLSLVSTLISKIASCTCSWAEDRECVNSTRNRYTWCSSAAFSTIAKLTDCLTCSILICSRWTWILTHISVSCKSSCHRNRANTKTLLAAWTCWATCSDSWWTTYFSCWAGCALRAPNERVKGRSCTYRDSWRFRVWTIITSWARCAWQLVCTWCCTDCAWLRW